MSIAIEDLLLGIVSQVQQEVQGNAQQATLDTVLKATNAVLTQVNATIALLTNPTYGLAAIQAELATFGATTAIDVTAILTAIAATQQSGSPVTLPGTTPAGGSWLDAGNAGGTVWGFALTPSGATAERALDYAYDVIYAVDQAGGWQYGYSPYFASLEAATWFGSFPFNTDTPQPDVNNILLGDTLVSWLTRELSPHWTVDTVTFPGQIYLSTAGQSNTFLCTLDAATFAILKSGVFPVASPSLAPVWPGLAGVTLGVPVALSDGLVLTGPLSGVLIDITSVAPPVSFYPFGTIKSYVRAGALVFTTDNGDSEFPQPFGPNFEIVLPKTMASADSATLRVTSGIVGTVTPFTIP